MSNNKIIDNKILVIIAMIVLIVVTIQAIHNISKSYELSKNTDKLQSIVQIKKVSDTKLSGDALYSSTGIAQMCINIPPVLTYDCNMSNAVLNTTKNYNCTFNATDANGDGISFYLKWLTSPTIFNMTSHGNVNFNPKKSAMNKINTFRVYVNDTSGCSNYYSYKDFNVTVVGENRPPYLFAPLSNEKVVKDQYFIFYLNDYFKDPDEDPLSYFSILESGSTIKVSIIGNTVQIKGLDCGVSKVYYVAMDPLGLTAQSNTVEYNVTCSKQNDASARSNGNSAGSGSGGGTDSKIDCTSDWRCGSWSGCQKGNFTYRRCVDFNACNQKNYERYLFDNCTYISQNTCVENWECSEWSTCKDGVHGRLCIDLNSCGTDNTHPLESEKCTLLSSCFNGIKDENETGIDCGGPCGACRNIEQPTTIQKTSLTSVLVAALGISVVIFAGFIFRNRIREWYLKLFGKKYLARKKIYLTNLQKDKLLQKLNVVQLRLDENKIDYAIDEMAVFLKEYFKQLLTIDALDKKELVYNIQKLQNKDLEKQLVSFYARISNLIHLRNKGETTSLFELQSLTDEMSHEIFLVSEFLDSDAISSVKDRFINKNSYVYNDTISGNNLTLNDYKNDTSDKSTNTPIDSISMLYNKISNIYIALKFGELIASKNIYLDALKIYESLSETEKIRAYDDIIRAYDSILYLEKLYSK